ncbi:hypothetical protein [Bacteroides congonensis]|uniref:hypothetical protein n=1 Tax=Bacteroides congonensis TaxID=1871006 RepID=UPI00189A168F|nr:hypothetical protein [Bacteroides congonensis]
MNSIKLGQSPKSRLITWVVCCFALCLSAWGNNAPAFKAEYVFCKQVFKCPANGYTRINRGKTIQLTSEVSAKRALEMIDGCDKFHPVLTSSSTNVLNYCFQKQGVVKSSDETYKQLDLLEHFEVSYKEDIQTQIDVHSQKTVCEDANYIFFGRIHLNSPLLITVVHFRENQQFNSLVSSKPERTLLNQLANIPQVSLAIHLNTNIRCDILLSPLQYSYFHAPPDGKQQQYFISNDNDSTHSSAEMSLNLHSQKNVSISSCIMDNRTKTENELKYLCSHYENNRLPHGKIHKSRKVPKIK